MQGSIAVAVLLYGRQLQLCTEVVRVQDWLRVPQSSQPFREKQGDTRSSAGTWSTRRHARGREGEHVHPYKLTLPKQGT